MGYSKDIYRLAYEQLEQKRERNKQELERRKQEIEQKIPEYRTARLQLFSLIEEGVRMVSEKRGHLTGTEIKEMANSLECKKRDLLVQNGYPANYLDDIYDCSVCRDTGFVMDRMCTCLDKILRDTAYNQSSIKYILDVQDISDFRLDYYDSHEKNGYPSSRSNMERILAVSKQFIECFDQPAEKSLLFSGSTGLGKTFLSSCVAREILGREHSVFYQTAAKIIDIIEDYKFYRKEAKYDIENAMENIYQSDLLIIDDLGTEARTTYSISAIFEIVNTRLLNHKKMIINSNLGLRDMEQIYTTRLTSRFIGSFHLCEFYGEDIRLLKALK